MRPEGSTPAPPAEELLAGAVDLHVHGAPDVVPRRHADSELAELARGAGMRAIVLKSHHESTVGRAALVRIQTGFAVHGGLVLNRFVSGGLSPDAVEAALAMGARIIWLPTMSSTAHRARFGTTRLAWTDAGRPAVAVRASTRAVRLDTPAAARALTTIARHVAAADAVLASGHVELAAIRLAARIAQRAGARFLVTHPDYTVPGLSVAEQRRLAAELPGVVFERCAYVHSPAAPEQVPARRIAEAIAATGGAARNVISSDMGQPQNPAYPEGLAGFAAALIATGVAAREVREMLTATPARVLGTGA